MLTDLRAKSKKVLALKVNQDLLQSSFRGQQDLKKDPLNLECCCGPSCDQDPWLITGRGKAGWKIHSRASWKQGEARHSAMQQTERPA